MEARTTCRPGQNGTKKLVQRFGDRLIFVRYRYDEQRRRRYTTVELIVDEQLWAPTPAASLSATAAFNPDSKVTLRIGVHEARVRARIKQAGAQWDPTTGVWILSLRRGRALQDRIVTV
jgi:hypothetical protein